MGALRVAVDDGVDEMAAWASATGANASEMRGRRRRVVVLLEGAWR
jgi:hypothetical protein